jgi:integrase
MTLALVPPTLPVTPEDFARRSRADNTLRSYVSDLHDYLRWLGGVPERYFDLSYERLLPALVEAGVFPVPPAAVERYLADLAGRVKYSTVTHRLNTLAKMHDVLGLEPVKTPRVNAVVEGIARTIGTRTDGAAALPLEALRAVDELLLSAAGFTAVRDRAMLLLCFAGGFRRGEVVALHIADVTLVEEGYRILVRKSKTDPRGIGITKAVPKGSRAYEALESWLAVLRAKDIYEGSLFRSINKAGRFGDGITARAFEDIVKSRLAQAGVEGKYSPHSLRSGFVTAAYRKTQDIEGIMRQTGHRSVRQVLNYVRETDAFQNPALDVLTFRNEK